MGNFKLYLFTGILILLVVIPIAKSVIQESSIGQDIRGIQMEYSMRGAESFRARLNEIVLRAPLDPEQVEILIQEDRSRGKAMVEIRYVSRMLVLFYPFERQVVVQQEIPLVPL